MKKLLVFSAITVLIILPAVLAVPTNCKIDFKFSRVITEEISEGKLKTFLQNGCKLRHLFKKGASFDCPEAVVDELDVRIAKILYVTDIQSAKQINADKVWDEGITGSGVKIAILDTGMDLDHPELQDSYLGGYDFVNDDSMPEDDNGHGTHIAGIITANGINPDAKGVAPNAGLYVYKVCDHSGTCYEDDVVAGLEAAVDSGSQIMSMSLGGEVYTGENCDSDFFAKHINWLVGQGLTAVISAGNDASGISTPGCASGAIAVGMVDESNNVPSWSGRGESLDIVASGISIYSTRIGGYGFSSGSSMAAPHVSGVIALLLEVDSTLDTDEIKKAIYETASPVNECDGEPVCTPEITGAGVVDAYEAYLYVKEGPDTDGDGVRDLKDRCPETPKDVEIDENGCSALQFCKSIDVRNNFFNILRCYGADWKDNERGWPKDCMLKRYKRYRYFECTATDNPN